MSKLEFLVEPHEAIAFDPVQFAMLLAYAQEVARGPYTVLNKPRKDIIVDDKPMDPGLQKVYGAISPRFRDDHLKVGSFMCRYFAFMRLLRSDVLGKFVDKSGEPDPDVVVELMAWFPLLADADGNSTVDPQAFLAELEKRHVS